MKVFYGVIGAALLMLLVAIGIQRTQIGHLTRDRDSWRDSARTYDEAWKAWAASYWQSEALRRQENGQARSAVTSDTAACDARVDAARSSASAITRIVTKEVQCAPGSAPVRSMFQPRELCDALTPGACSGSAAKAESR